MAKAVYELEPTGLDGGLEANGCIEFACSAGCADDLKLGLLIDGAIGVDIGECNDYIDGTVCELCGKRLTN